MKITVNSFDSIKEQFLFDIQTAVEMEDIPPELVLNWDQTGISIVPGSSWMMELKGAKRVAIAGISDKRQITAVLCGTMAGDFLPLSSSTKARPLPVTHGTSFLITGILPALQTTG